MFRVKICGITRASDILAAAEAGADAVGLNFYPRSLRGLQLEQARPLAAAVPPGVTKVGVFVNAEEDVVCRAFDELGLDLIQLHGDEPPEFLPRLSGRPVIRAFRCGAEGLLPVRESLDKHRQQGAMPAAVLIDAQHSGAFGGTGQTAPWHLLADWRTQLGEVPLILAGGLVPGNVAAAIEAVRPWGVDTASGVEEAPGVKDAAKIRAFVAAARAALAEF